MKKWKKILLLIGIFAAAFVAGNTVKYYLDFWKADRAVKSFQSAIDAIYSNDTYGGKTPEETFDLYLAALKKGDLELASKYFVVEKQKKELETLVDQKKDNKIDNFISKLENAKQVWSVGDTDDTNKFVYDYKEIVKVQQTIDVLDPQTKEIIDKLTLEPGTYSHSVVLEKKDNVWKIYSL